MFSDVKVVFFGNSDLSVLVLKKLITLFRCFVITSQDKPAGRGLELKPNAVKNFCIQNKINFLDTDDWEKIYSTIYDFKPDFMVVASYGKIIPKKILYLLDQKRRLNVHPSLLPRWRGPAPVQWAILSQDEKTGVTICTVEEKVDSGYIVSQEEIKISDDDTYLTLSQKLFELGADLLIKSIHDIILGKAKFLAQDESSATWAKAIKKEDGFFSFQERAQDIHRKMRAFCIWPKIFTKIKGETVKIHETFLPDFEFDGKPGTIVKINEESFWVLCGDKKPIAIKKIQRPGKKVVSGKDFVNGLRLKVGDSVA
jgi:methionyl-tRNA formyltransferase